MPPWKIRAAPPGETLRYALPPIEMWVRRTREECLVGVLPGAGEARDNTVESGAEVPEKIAWRRFAVPPEMTVLRVRPATPDRSLVVRPADSLSILAGHATDLFVSVPLSWRVELGRSRDSMTILDEVPSVTLTKSWFGENTGGEPCYALKTRALHVLGDERANRFYCRVHLKNDGALPFVLERFCLQTPALALYAADNGRLWTNDVRVSLRQEGAPVGVPHIEAPPAQCPGALLVTPARRNVSQRRAFRALDPFRSKF